MRVVRFIVVFLISVQWCLGQDKDSARVGKDPDSISVTQPAVPGQQMPELKTGRPFSEVSAVKLQREEVPLFLQRTLQDEKFRGWENGAVYRDIETNEYKVDIVNGEKSESFYFDKSGTLLKSK